MRAIQRLSQRVALPHARATIAIKPMLVVVQGRPNPSLAQRLWSNAPFSSDTRFNIARYEADSDEAKSVEDEISALQVSVQTLRNDGRFTEAKEAAVTCLDLIEQVFGKEHPVFASGANNLGVLCRDLGDFDAAIEYYIMAYQTYQSIVGESHRSTAIAMHNLANTYKLYSEQKRGIERHQLLLQAKELFQDTLAVRKAILGDRHPETGSTMQNLGRVLSQLDGQEEALSHVVGGAEIIEAALGDKHPQAAIAWNNVGFHYKTINNFEQALVWYEKSLELTQSLYGSSHVQTITVRHNMAELYHALGDEQKATEIREGILRDMDS